MDMISKTGSTSTQTRVNRLRRSAHRLRSRPGAVLALVAAVVALTAVTTLAWIWRHPQAINASGGDLTWEPEWTLGETFYVGVTYPDRSAAGVATLHRAALHDPSGHHYATFTYWLCTPDRGSWLGTANEATLRESCARIAPAIDATMDLATQQLVVGVTPEAAGEITFEGIEVTYTHGWQTGTELVGPHVGIIARDS